MRKSIALITLILAILIFVAGCDDSWLNFDSTDEQEDVAEIYVLAEEQSVDKNGEAGAYVLYDYNTGGQLVKEYHWSNKPKYLSSAMNEIDKNKTSVIKYTYYESGVLKEIERIGWRKNTWTTIRTTKYDENGLMIKETYRVSRHTESPTYEYSFDENNRIIKKTRMYATDRTEYLYEYSEDGLLIKETENKYVDFNQPTGAKEINYFYSEDGSLIEKDEQETYNYLSDKFQHTNHKYNYEWSTDRSVCVETYLKDDVISTQYEITYDSNGNILIKKNLLTGSYTEYVYEWLPDYYAKMKKIR